MTIDIPRNLDPELVAETQRQLGRASYVSFLWYRGTDSQGQPQVFRFMKGGELGKFHDHLRKLQMVSISGPYKTRTDACKP